jgi:hypothetical protein
LIKKIILYFLIITALLFGIRALHYKGLLRQTKGYYAKYKTAFLEKNNFNVVFLGSSRAEMHYDTGMFDSLTQQHAFNLSLAGATPHVAFAALTAYLSKSRAPAYLMYEIDYHALKYKSSEVKEFNNYFPFLSDPVFRKALNGIDARMNHFYYDPYFSLPFTGLKNLSTSLHGWLNLPNKTDGFYHNGFFKEVLRPHLNYMAEQKTYTYFHVAERAYLDSIISTCKKHNIHITLVSSPVFGGGKTELYNKDQIIKQLKNIAAINQIRYFDLSSLPFCNNRNLFVDHYHLNYAVAEKFTPYLARVFNNKIAIHSLK